MTEDGLSPSPPSGAGSLSPTPLPEPPPLHTMAPPPLAHPPRAARRLAVFALLFLGGAATGSGVAAGVLIARQTPPVTASAGAPTTNPSNGSSAPSGDGPTTTPKPTPATGTTSTSSIAAKVDPAIVDITATLAGSGGRVAGTGMVITSSGEVLTNNHVIEGTSGISVQINGSGTTYTATLLGTDAADDIALLQIQGVSGLKTVTIGDSSAATVGETVVAIGNALGRGGTPAATQGSITALNQTITAGDSPANTETLNGVIQIDAFIQPGDSGGPLVDTSGKVIGIDTAAQATGRFADAGSTVAFAIPINKAMAIAHQIETGQSSSHIQIGTRGIIGVQARDGASASGAVASAVESGSPAERAGIAAGDVITSVGASGTTSASTLHAALQGNHPGDSVVVGWLDASGQHHSATITLVAGPPA